MFDKRNIRIYYLRTLEKIRSFLLSRNSREFLIFLFFVFVSFCFWLLQILNDDYETEFSIPLRMKNVPNNVVLSIRLQLILRIMRAKARKYVFRFLLCWRKLQVNWTSRLACWLFGLTHWSLFILRGKLKKFLSSCREKLI